MISNEQRQYKGYLLTPQLWENTPITGLQQISLSKLITKPIESNNLNKRLGHRVEQFVFHELNNIPNCKVVAHNIQIIDQKITIGELDCIVKYQNTSIHLEIVYKFYLYDETVGTTEIDRWIGPNRNDSFVDKITKLTTKQLPLVQHPITQSVLRELETPIYELQQQVYFKAQLFVPYAQLHDSFTIINNDCIIGFYLHYSDIEQLKNHQFFIPQKLDWLVIPHEQVDWIPLSTFKQTVMPFMEKNYAPMCWLKASNGKLQKFFVVWW